MRSGVEAGELELELELSVELLTVMIPNQIERKTDGRLAAFVRLTFTTDAHITNTTNLYSALIYSTPIAVELKRWTKS